MTKNFRVGVMGAAWPGTRHAEAFRALKGVKVAALSEPNPERQAEFSKTFGKVERYSDYRDMLAKAELDAVVCALPTNLHHQACLDSLEAGAHVLCEKPPTLRAAEMKDIADLAKAKGLTYMFGRQPRFRPEILAARQAVATGALGKVYLAEAKWINARSIPWEAGGWRFDKARGGGVLLDLGAHAIDNAWFVMGCPKPLEVFAGLHTAFGAYSPTGSVYTADDAAAGFIRFDNDATLQFLVTFAANTPGPRHETPPKSLYNPSWRELVFYGDKGGIDIESGRAAIGQADGVNIKPFPGGRRRPIEEPLTRIRRLFLAQAKEFRRAITSGTEPMNNADQAVTLMTMLDALRESGEKRRAVTL